MSRFHQQLASLPEAQVGTLARLIRQAAPQTGEPTSLTLVAMVVTRPGAIVDSAELDSFARARLPTYMVPSQVVLADSLPMTRNGKLDRIAARAEAAQWTLNQRPAYSEPQGDIERRLAEAFATLLKKCPIGRHDNFFHLGGDSIQSLQLAARCRQDGLEFNARDLFTHQTVATLAAVTRVVDTSGQEVEETNEGPFPLSPIQRWLVETQPNCLDHWNQSLLFEVSEDVTPAFVAAFVRAIVARHDAFRTAFRSPTPEEALVGLQGDDVASPLFINVDLTCLSEADRSRALAKTSEDMQRGFDLAAGGLLRVAYFDFGAGDRSRVLFVAHHMVVDYVSWRILADEFRTALGQFKAGRPVDLGPPVTSYGRWASALRRAAVSTEVARQIDYWEQQCGGPASLARDTDVGLARDAGAVSVELEPEETAALLRVAARMPDSKLDHLIVTALATALRACTGAQSLRLELEWHGRSEIPDVPDVSGTVGWFTTLYPVTLSLPDLELPHLYAAVREQVRVPHHGTGYMLLKYHGSREARSRLAATPALDASVNYLGEFDTVTADLGGLKLASTQPKSTRHPNSPQLCPLEIVALVLDGKLRIDCAYSERVYPPGAVGRIVNELRTSLRALSAGLECPSWQVHTPADFPDLSLDRRDLEELLTQIDAV